MVSKLYYYTTQDEYLCILNLGLVWTNDGICGEGIYLTEMPPVLGRKTVVDHLYSGKQDNYGNTEVCLETSDEDIIVSKVKTSHGYCIWMCKTQLGIVSFQFGYFQTGSSYGIKKSLRSQMKPEHFTVSITKSPVSQLKELLDRQGTMLHYVFAHSEGMYTCIVKSGCKTAEGKGSYKKKAKSEAAKRFIRQIIVDEPRTHSKTNEESVQTPFSNNRATDKVFHFHHPNSLDSHHFESKNGTVCDEDNVVSKTSGANIIVPDVPVIKNGNVRVSFRGDSKDVEDLINRLLEVCFGHSPPRPVYDVEISVGEDEARGFNYAQGAVDVARRGDGPEGDLPRLLPPTGLGGPAGLNGRPTPRSQSPTGKECQHPAAPGRPREVNDEAERLSANHVGALQYLCAARGWTFPCYLERGTGSDGKFNVDCILLEFCERGSNNSKKKAKQQAALKILKNVENL